MNSKVQTKNRKRLSYVRSVLISFLYSVILSIVLGLVFEKKKEKEIMELEVKVIPYSLKALVKYGTIIDEDTFRYASMFYY